MIRVSSQDVGSRWMARRAFAALGVKINKIRDLRRESAGEHHRDRGGHRYPLKVTLNGGIVATGDLAFQPDPPSVAEGFVDFGGERCRVVVRNFKGEWIGPGEEGERHSVLLTHGGSSCSSVGGTSEGTASPGRCDAAAPGEPFDESPIGHPLREDQGQPAGGRTNVGGPGAVTPGSGAAGGRTEGGVA